VESAPPAGAKLLAGAQEKLGFVPNMYGAMANLGGVLILVKTLRGFQLLGSSVRLWLVGSQFCGGRERWPRGA
jgi:hypothetical protein